MARDQYRRVVRSWRPIVPLLIPVLLAGCLHNGPKTRSAPPAVTVYPGPGGSEPVPRPPFDDPYLARVPKFAPPPVPVPLPPVPGPYAPIYQRLPVTQPVAFLTIDDGLFRPSEDIPLMQAARIPFTMFLIAPVAASDPAFFAQLERAGGVIEDHTITHPILRGRSYAYQRHQICDAEPTLRQAFGRQPVLFRPPFGDYDRTTLRAVRDCGLKAAFFWTETVNNGHVQYQTDVHRIQPGDIILMHFRPNFVNDVLAALNAIYHAGLVPALLEDYIT